jgi:hypothetical protein
MLYSSFTLINDKGIDVSFFTQESDSTPFISAPQLFAEMSILWGCLPYNIATVTLPKTTFDKFGMFNEDMIYAGDFEMWTRISATKLIGRDRKRLIQLRSHNMQFSAAPETKIYGVSEAYECHKEMLKRIRPEFQKEAFFIFKWKTQVSYYFTFLSLIKKNQWYAAFQILRFLIKETNGILLTLRSFLILALKIFHKSDNFYYKNAVKKHLEYLNNYNKTHN